MIPIQYNLQSLGARRLTTVLTALGIALVVFVFASVLMLSNGLDEAMRTTGSPENVLVMRDIAQNEMQSRIGLYWRDGIDREGVGNLRSAPEVVASTAEVVVVFTAPKRESAGGGVTNVMVRGVEPSSFTLRPQVKIVEGRMPAPGSDEVIVGKSIADRIAGLDVGASLNLRGERAVKVAGIFTADGTSFESEVWGSAETIRAIFHKQGLISSLTLRLADPAAFEAFRDRVAKDQRLSLVARRESDYYVEQAKGLSSFLSALGLVIAVFFSVGAMIGAMITMYSQVAQRTREIGVLRAMGFRPKSILASFVLESVLLSLAGGLFGGLAALAMSRFEFSTLNAQTYSEVVFRFQPSFDVLLAALIFAIGMGLVGGLFPAVRASRIGTITALRGG